MGSGGVGTPLVRAMRVGVPVLVDHDQSVYHDFGLGRTAAGMLQKAATYVIDSEGTIRFAMASFNPYAAFDEDRVMRAVRALRG